MCDPRDNARKITQVLTGVINETGLYRTAVAGPSGQRTSVQVGTVRSVDFGPYEVLVIDPRDGTRVGYAARARGLSKWADGCEWMFWRLDADGGAWLHGAASSLAIGVDVLVRGEHMATGRHDAYRTSGGTWRAYPDRMGA